MSDFFVIAEEELVLAFRMVGVEGRAASGRIEALEAFREVTIGDRDRAKGPARRSGAAKVLILTEEIMDLLEEEAMEWQMSGQFPLIVEIPAQGLRSDTRRGLVEAVRQAIGVRI